MSLNGNKSVPDTLCRQPAVSLAELIRSREISATELMAAHLQQIESLNPALNAIVTLAADRAMDEARNQDKQLATGKNPGPLAGLPMVHKDLVATKGMRTTFGSRLFAHHVPDDNALMVERMQAAGGITLGKTNTPEFGAGSQTFNALFGATRNPYDLSKTCGGSSGGAAVALASGMAPIADGSDLGGSLRNPASFCNVVGFRPSSGRVPDYPSQMAWFPLGVLGPMGRTVSDVALLLSVQAGWDPRCPISLTESPAIYSKPLKTDLNNLRIAFSPDLGELPVDKTVDQVIRTALPHFESLGCRVDQANPDLTDADSIFKILRAWRCASHHGEQIKTHRNLFKDTLIWNIEEGLKLSGEDVARAEKARTALHYRMTAFFEDFDFLVLPVSQVPPFDIETEYVTRINDTDMLTYIDWMKSCYYITTTGLPAISVPCGFTDSGLPVGIQIVGRYHQDLAVLQMAWGFEQANPVWKTAPPVSFSMSQNDSAP